MKTLICSIHHITLQKSLLNRIILHIRDPALSCNIIQDSLLDLKILHTSACLILQYYTGEPTLIMQYYTGESKFIIQYYTGEPTYVTQKGHHRSCIIVQESLLHHAILHRRAYLILQYYAGEPAASYNSM